MNKRLKNCLLVILTILILFSTNIVITFAKTKEELEEERRKTQSEIDETNEKIDEVQGELDNLMLEIEDLSDQIDTYETELDELDEQLSDLETSIEETQKELEEAEENYENQSEMLESRIVALYEAGETTYLDVLLTSSSLTDFISNYYMISEVAEYDTELLNQMEKTKNEIEEAKKTLEESKEEIEKVKKTKEEKKKSLKNSQDEKEEAVSQLSEEEKALQESLDELKEDNKAIDAKIKALSQSSSQTTTTTTTTTPSTCGYIYPVPGYTTITTGLYYSWGGYHGSVDFGQAGVNGQPVVAVKDGTVVISEALRSSSGGYRSYGEYIVINHHDGTYTLYAHGQAGSRCVSAGQSVKQGQQIMRVGSTGNSTGAHLHFEVRLSPGTYGSRVNPVPYLP